MRNPSKVLAAGLWAIFVVLPAAVMAVQSSQPVASAHIERLWGELAGPYLGAAPAGFVVYLLSAQWLVVPTAILLLNRMRGALQDGADGRATARTLLEGLCTWLGLLVGGILVVAVGELLGGAALALTWGWAWRVSLLGTTALFPALGVSVLASFTCRRTWVAFLVAIALSFALMVAETVLRHWEIVFGPSILKEQVFSGREEFLLHGCLGLLAWGGLPILVGAAFALRSTVGKHAALAR